MPIVIERKSSFIAMPEGVHEAVISEVRDLGKVQTKFGEKEQIVARFVNADGEEASRFYTRSLHEKSILAKDIKVLFGSVPDKFDVESLVGKQVQVVITAGTNSKGQPTARVQSLLKPKKGQNVPLPKGSTAKTAGKPPEDSQLINDDDIPF